MINVTYSLDADTEDEWTAYLLIIDAAIASGEIDEVSRDHATRVVVFRKRYAIDAAHNVESLPA